MGMSDDDSTFTGSDRAKAACRPESDFERRARKAVEGAADRLRRIDEAMAQGASYNEAVLLVYSQPTPALDKAHDHE